MTVTIDGSAGVTTNSGAVYNGLITGTAVTLSTQTSVDFTSIPSWVKRISVIISGLTSSSTSGILVQIGSTTFTTSGYLGSAVELRATPSATAFTAGFGISGSPVAGNLIYGIMTISNITGNTWVSSISFGGSTAVYAYAGGGRLALSGVLDRVRLTTVNGTDTFTAGSVNIMYE